VALLLRFGFNTHSEKDGFPTTESRLFSLFWHEKTARQMPDGFPL
jgi:hypothetical protein